MKNKNFKPGRWVGPYHVDDSLSEWSQEFMEYSPMAYSSCDRTVDFVAIARMFAWTLKKMGVTYKNYKEMDEDGVPALIQQVWYDDSKLS